MINKKNLLTRTPEELGFKDAVHVAIVSVRAGQHLSVGQEITINEYNEAVSSNKGIGYVSPFVQGDILRGTNFWMLLKPHEVPNVQHYWEHDKFDFAPPKREVQKNKYLCNIADKFKLTYEQLMNACRQCVDTWAPVKYEGLLSEKEFEEALEEYEYEIRYDVWSEWSDEANYEFSNMGTDCCPEYDLPECRLFYFEDNSISEE